MTKHPGETNEFSNISIFDNRKEILYGGGWSTLKGSTFSEDYCMSHSNLEAIMKKK
jgi:hypothetical protein